MILVTTSTENYNYYPAVHKNCKDQLCAHTHTSQCTNSLPPAYVEVFVPAQTIMTHVPVSHICHSLGGNSSTNYHAQV